MQAPGRRRQAAADDGGHGRAGQVYPIKPTLKAPGTERLKLKYEEQLSNFGFKFKFRRYSMATEHPSNVAIALSQEKITLNEVGRCRLTLSNPS